MLNLWRTVRHARFNQLATYSRHYIPALIDSRRILETIDPEKKEWCRKILQNETDHRVLYAHHFEPRDYLIISLYRAYKLNLHRVKPMHILDISTGLGYFPYVCNYFGHDVVCTDVDTNPLYNDLTRLLDVRRLPWKIRAYEKSPNFGAKFDLVTAFLVSFNQGDWRKEEWGFFLKDLSRNCLHSDSRVFLGLNPIRSGKYYDYDLKDFFLKYGARLYNEKSVYFPSMRSFIA